MLYVSTRGAAPSRDFEHVLLSGLAQDGGLYVPKIWPKFTHDDLETFRDLSYSDLAFRIIKPFVGQTIQDTNLKAILSEVYSSFSHPEVAPLKNLAPNLYLLELFHGPTLAFKDFALQVLGRLFDYFLSKRGERVTVIGATSGDTGSAAIEACRGRDAIDIFILHPKGRVSDIQRRQMTTVTDSNVFNIGIEGTFDDCQDLVKSMFCDQKFCKEQNLSAVNSINWARIMAQIVYYFFAALKLGSPKRSVSFSVPTGNFGNICAGYVALKMGLPIRRLILGTNSNDILVRFFETGEMITQPVVSTLSPAMDIQISSNFERVLFDLSGGDGSSVKSVMEDFRHQGKMRPKIEIFEKACSLFYASRLDDQGIKNQIEKIYQNNNLIIDPHTATGIHAAEGFMRKDNTPLVALGTAHPSKFPEAVEEAIGVKPSLPAKLSSLMERHEQVTYLPSNLSRVKKYIRQHSQRHEC